MVAVVEGLRGGDRTDGVSAAPDPESGGPAGGDGRLAQELRAAGALGLLLLSDGSCHVVGVRLPDLTRETVRARTDCPGHGTPGSSPRSLSLPREALGTSGPLTVRETVSLGGDRHAAIVHDESRDLDLVAVFENGRLVTKPQLGHSRLSGLSASPRRLHLAVRAPSGGVWLLDRDGRFFVQDRLRLFLLDVRSLAWSPDETFAALATRESVILLRLDRFAPRAFRLPLAAAALEWQ